jgi:hypothetical protein
MAASSRYSTSILGSWNSYWLIDGSSNIYIYNIGEDGSGQKTEITRPNVADFHQQK